MSSDSIILPGDISKLNEIIDENPSVRLGPGLFQNAVTDPVPVKAGYLTSSRAGKNNSTVYIESNSKRVS